MATTQLDVDEALKRISEALGVGGPGTAGTPATPGPGGTTAPVTTGNGTLSLAQEQRVARLAMYQVGLAVIDTPRLDELEAGLPEVPVFLGSLPGRPVTYNRLKKYIDDLTKLHQAKAQQDPDEQRRLEEFAALLQANLPPAEERLIPLIALSLAAFMAGYTIAHGWDR